MSAACTCGCCEGVEQVTPLPIANRPGLPALSYRVGTHATFLETMVARLSSNDFPALAALRTRDPGDPAIALLDSWAVVADVLTFYQERIANEGYLRTATERESILELARLIGYKLRPGVSASVYLAYTLDEDRSQTPPLPTAVTIPAGSRSQSVPGPGESPQSFETSADLDARSEWNNLQVRLTKPQTENTVMNGARNDPDPGVPRVYLQGVTTNLKPNDPLLIDFGDGTTPTPFRVLEVKPDAAANRTRVNLQVWPSAAMQQPPAQSIRKILAKQRDAIKSSGLTKLTIVKKVAKSLSDLQIQVDSGQHQDALAKYIQSITLPSLAKVLPTAQTHPRKRTLVPLLNNLTQQLTAAIESLSSVVPEPVAPSSAPSDRVFQTPELLAPLLKQSTSLPPASSAELPRDTKSTFAGNAETNLQLLRGFEPKLEGTLSDALANAKVTPDSGIKVYALRVKASPFGSNAPKKVLQIDKDTGEILEVGEWPIVEWEIEPTSGLRVGPITFELGGPIAHEQSHILYLDANYEKITAGTVWNPSWVLIDQSAWIPSQRQSPQPEVTAMSNQPVIAQIEQVQTDIARADYGISGKTTRIQLSVPWLNIHEDVDNLAGSSSTSLENLQTILQLVYDLDFAILRNTAVYAQSEELPLAEEPIFDPVCDGHNPNHRIELDGLYDGLQSGRWLIVSGERVDIPGTTGVQASELMMLAGVEYKVSRIKAPAQPSQDQTAVASPPSPKMIDLPGDRIHTFLTLSDKLLYCYKRDTLTIYGNVVEATNGEMRNEALGNGDASQTLQQFTLKQSPLTFVSAPNTAGVDSTLVVRVNDVEWHEQDSLADLGPQDRAFITTTDDNDQTTVIFGDGVEGARLPTGTANVKATYRNGIGAAGNVKVGQISLLQTRPLNVKGVINPLPASGGADRDSRDQARRNAPLAVMALDRLVSTQDYADFARTFAGIGKASAVRLTDGQRQLVHVTIAGVDDIPIDTTSDLYRNLGQSLLDYGDPYLPIKVAVRQAMFLVIQASVQVLPDYLWEDVQTDIRTALLQAFSFDRRDLGQTAWPSEAISTMQAVEGVAYVNLEMFDALSEDQVTQSLSNGSPLSNLIAATPQVVLAGLATPNPTATDFSQGITPAALAYLTPEVPDTLILNAVTP